MTTSERRRTPRVTCVLPVRLYSRDGDFKVIETLTKDLGLGGLRCLSPVSKSAQAAVSLEITLGAGEKPLNLRAHIAWFHVVKGSKQFYLGLSFDHLSDQDTKLLSMYLDKISK